MSEESKALAKLEPVMTPDEGDLLTDFERTALSVYRQKKGQPQLAPALSAQLYELFLEGVSCEDISKANPGISLGQVLDTRFQYGWDAHKQRYLDDLMDNAKGRVQQIQLEALEFLRTSLAVAHKAFGDKAKKFLQSGQKKDMPDPDAFPWGRYKQQLELLMKLTGTAPPERQQVSGMVRHEHQVTVTGGAPALPGGMTAQAAAEALAAFEKDGNLYNPQGSGKKVD